MHLWHDARRPSRCAASATFDLDIHLEAKAGELVALLGPNGAGKSTVFRCLAGLLPIDARRIELDGECLDDPAEDSSSRPSGAAVAVVFQDYLLFSNLTALENVAFGLRARGMGKAKAAGPRPRPGSTGSAWPTGPSTGRGHFQAGKPSGSRWPGPSPPNPACCSSTSRLAALDAGTRGEVRRDLRRHLTTFDGVHLLVTHDPVDAYTLADRVIILESRPHRPGRHPR